MSDKEGWVWVMTQFTEYVSLFGSPPSHPHFVMTGSERVEQMKQQGHSHRGNGIQHYIYSERVKGSGGGVDGMSDRPSDMQLG